MSHTTTAIRRIATYGIGGLMLFVLLLASSADKASDRLRYLKYAYPPNISLPRRPLPGSFYLEDAVARSEKLWRRHRAKRGAFVKEQGGLAQMKMFKSKSDMSGWLQRYTLWDVYVPAFPCPWEVERIGRMSDGGKFTCGFDRLAARRKEDLVVYSFGVNSESSWEAEILSRSEGQVWMYDFTVDTYGPELQQAPSNISERAHFFKYGLGEDDGVKQGHQFHSLQSLMRMNGHNHIDILKIDIEGGEFGILPEIVDHFGPGNLPFDQLLLEVHVEATRDPYSFAQFGEFWETLEDAGLRLSLSELNYPAIDWNPYPSAMEYNLLNDCNGKLKCGHLLRE